MNKGCKTCGKYKYKSGTRKIETEGREPVFDSKGELIYYNPNDPTHNEGGVKAVVVPKDTYSTNQLQAINKTSKTKIFPEGSSIVTAQKGKAQEALIAYRNGNKSLLNKVIKSMPEDSPNTTGESKYMNSNEELSYHIDNMKKMKDTNNKGLKPSKYKDGVKATRGGVGYYQVTPEELQAKNNLAMQGYANARGLAADKSFRGYNVTPEEIEDNQNKQAAYEASTKYSLTPEQSAKAAKMYDTTKGTETPYSNGKYIADLGVAAASNVPMWYNLAMGKQSSQKEQRNYIPKVSLNDSYNIEAQVRNINSTYANQAGIVNQNAGTAQNRKSATNAIYSQKRQKMNELLANKANYLSNLKNQETMTNSQIDAQNVNLKNVYNDLDSRNRGARQQFDRTAAEQAKQGVNESINYANKNYQDYYNRDSIKQYFDLKSKDLESKYGDKSTDKIYLDTDGKSKYKLDTDGKTKLYLQSKGNKYLKYKMKGSKNC